MSSKLTRTEELAARLYFNEGLKPKEIAQRLGISVNTVYKAISKYRAYMKSMEQQPPSSEGQGVDDEDAVDNSGGNSVFGVGGYVLNVRLSIVAGTQQMPVASDTTGESYQGELMKELRVLRELVSKLIEKVEVLERSSVGACREGEGSTGNGDVANDLSVPDFIRGNPWIDVIKSIHSVA